MQCLQALCASKLSTSGRQRDRQQEQQQQLPQQSACNIPISISHDVRSFQIQYPVLGVANIGHEGTGINSGNNSTKKRKAECFPKPKETRSSVTEDSNSKRMKEETAGKVATSYTKQPKNEKKSSGDGSKEKSKPPEADYIHVRARRGQATDSHSLAERVRRERISERMKYLQDLVPGCNKIMGKASMLDEIINYVQSLQRQVEFLSMKLAAVNLISDNSNIFDTELNSACNSSSMPVIGMPSYQLDLSGFQLDSLQQGHACSGLNVFMNAPVTVADTLDSCLINAHGSSAWGTGLHSFYGVEFQEGRESAFTSQSLQGGNIQSNNLKRDM